MSPVEPAIAEQSSSPVREAVWWRSTWSGVLGLAERCGWTGAVVDVDKLLTRARKDTGHDDFGDPEFMEPLARLVNEFHARATPDVLGRQIFAQVLLASLRNRLRMRATLRAHPEIAETAVVAPIFIVGFPRTGTTLLQGLLANVRGLRTPRQWETNLGDSPPALSSPREIAKQIKFAKHQMNFVNAISPDLAKAHEIGAELPEECNPLLMSSLRAMFFALLFDCPDYVDYIYATGFRNAYAWHKLHLQILAYRQPSSTWVLKGPIHLASLDALLETYPDARVVFTHRDPAESVPSMSALGACLRGLVSPTIDRRHIASKLVASLARMQEEAAATRGRWPAASPAFIDIRYDDLVRDPLATVRAILRHFEMAEHGDFDASVERYMRANRRHRRGEHRYDLAEFGLAADEVRAVFQREVRWLAEAETQHESPVRTTRMHA